MATKLQDGDLPPAPPVESPDEIRAQESARIAELRFLDPAAISKTFTLEFPFEWEGREIREITVRRLAVAEVGAILAGLETADRYEFYAAMTGLPKEVLKALRDEDVIFEGCSPFLPRVVKALFSAPPQNTGDDTQSQRQERQTSD